MMMGNTLTVRQHLHRQTNKQTNKRVRTVINQTELIKMYFTKPSRNRAQQMDSHFFIFEASEQLGASLIHKTEETNSTI